MSSCCFSSLSFFFQGMFHLQKPPNKYRTLIRCVWWIASQVRLYYVLLTCVHCAALIRHSHRPIGTKLIKEFNCNCQIPVDRALVDMQLMYSHVRKVFVLWKGWLSFWWIFWNVSNVFYIISHIFLHQLIYLCTYFVIAVCKRKKNMWCWWNYA